MQNRYKKSIAFFLRVSILSIFFISILNFPLFIGINASAVDTGVYKNTENKYEYKNIKLKSLSTVGVAITSNVGIRYKQRQALPATIYKEILSLEEILSSDGGKIAKDDLISKNMILIHEYLNILKTDVKSLIDKSYDKSSTLNIFTSVLRDRYNLSIKNVSSLNSQKQVLESTMTNINNQIEQLKLKISQDFKNVDTVSTGENIDKYLELKHQYYYARTYVIFINKFIEQYSFLNNYNKNLATVLLNNRDAIIKDSYVVISNTDINILENLDLVIDEEDFRKTN